MATHLMEQPQHSCIMSTHKDTHSGPSACLEDSDTFERQTHTPAASEDRDNQDAIDNNDSVTSLPARTGAFIPIQLGPAHQNSCQLSVKPLAVPPPPSPPPAIVIKFQGPRRWTPAQPELRPLSKSQLAVVLSSLCHGVSQAALQFHVSPETIWSWTEQQRRSLAHRKPLSGTDAMTELVLSRREKQLWLDEDVLLLMAKTTMELEGQAQTKEGQTMVNEQQDGKTKTNEGQTKTIEGQTKMNEGQNGKTETNDGQTEINEEKDGQTNEGQDRQTKTLTEEEEQQQLTCYNWMVDFMLSQQLGLNDSQRTLTRTLRSRSNTFIHTLSAEILSRQLPPNSVGCIDEFPIFVDLNLYQNQDQLALQFSEARKEPPLLDVVLSALSDGTFLTPLLCFTGFVVPVPDGFPDNVVLESRTHGFTHQERLNIWVQKVWQQHVASQVQGPSLLIMDPYRGHQNLKFRSTLSDWSTTVHYMPAGCCACVQPLDVCVTPVLRGFLQARWTQLVSDGGLDGLSLDQLALTLACWFSEFSSTLTAESHFLSRSFSSVLDLQWTKAPDEAEKMMADLTQAVVQPLETRGAGEEAEPGGGAGGAAGEVLKEVKAEKEERLRDSLSACHQVFKGDSDMESFQGFLNE